MVKEPEQMRKLFIGGLNYQTTDEGLKGYFEQFGEIVDVVVMKDTFSKRSKGFGFVTFAESYMVDEAQKNRPHKIDGRSVDSRRAVPRDEAGKPGAGLSVKKLFVGGINDEVEEDDLREVFSQFGEVVAVSIPVDRASLKKRSFAFVEFSDHDAVDKACCECPHKDIQVKNRTVAIKKALSKDEMLKVSSRGRGGGRGGGRNDNWGNNQDRNSGWGNQGSGGGYNQGGGGGGGYNQGGGGGGGYNQGGGGGGYNQGGGGGGYNQGGGGGGYNQGGGGGGSGYNQGGGGGGGYNQGGGGGGYGGNQGSGGYGGGNQGSSGGWQSGQSSSGGGGGGGGFGSNYNQSYGGGPMRSQGYGGGSNSTPYNSGGGGGGGNWGQGNRY